MSPILRAAAVPLVVAVLALTPFLDKAFGIDDPIFLLEARHALTDPLHPTAFSMAWNEDVPERVSSTVPSGPVGAWLLVPAVAAGGAEWLAHAVHLLLLLAAVLATVSVGLRLGLSVGWAGAAGALLITTPVVLGMAGTVMPDVPAMALGVLGTERVLAWRQEGGAVRAVLGALLLALASLTRTQLGLLLPLVPLLLAADHVFSADRVRAVARGIWPAALAAAIAALILLVTRDPATGSGGIASSAASLSRMENVTFNTLCLGLNWALATTFVVAWLALRPREMAGRWWLLLAASILLAALRWLQRGSAATYWVVPVAAIGLVVILDVLLDALVRRDGLQLVLGAWLLLPLPIVIYTHFPAKYLVASVPAACLLIARAGQRTPLRARWVVGAAAAAGLLLGIAILRADSAFSDVARSGVRRLVTPELREGRTLWYDGHWGLHWYAEAAGARPWTATRSQPGPGDLILTNAVRPYPLDASIFRSLVHLRRYEDRTPGGRVMSVRSGAGFFSNAWGYLPWAWGDDLIDAVDLWLAPGGTSPPPPAEPRLIRPAG